MYLQPFVCVYVYHRNQSNVYWGTHPNGVYTTLCWGAHTDGLSLPLYVLGYIHRWGPHCCLMGYMYRWVTCALWRLYVALRGLVRAEYTPCLSFRDWLWLPCLPSLPGGVCAQAPSSMNTSLCRAPRLDPISVIYIFHNSIWSGLSNLLHSCVLCSL